MFIAFGIKNTNDRLATNCS